MSGRLPCADPGDLGLSGREGGSDVSLDVDGRCRDHTRR